MAESPFPRNNWQAGEKHAREEHGPEHEENTFQRYFRGIAEVCVSAARSLFIPRHPLFHAEEFCQSPLWQGHTGKEGLYPAWAAAARNTVVENLRQGIPIDQIWNMLAKKRQELALAQGNNNEQFGIVRRGEHAATPIAHADKKTGILASTADLLRKYGQMPTTVDAEGFSGMKQNWYFDENGNRQKTTALYCGDGKARFGADEILYGAGEIIALHPEGNESQNIFQDINRRLENLRNSAEHPVEKKREFLICMHGFYNAMPYIRGSAAMGQAFFEGYYLAVFGDRMPPFSKEISVDTAAMGLTDEQFVEEFGPAFGITRLRKKPPSSDGG